MLRRKLSVPFCFPLQSFLGQGRQASLALLCLAALCAIAPQAGFGGQMQAKLMPRFMPGTEVTKAVTTTTLSVASGGSSVTTVAGGSLVTLTATVTAGGKAVTPGTVVFCDATVDSCAGSGVVGSAQLTPAGTATLKFFPSVGSHSYKGVFAGNTADASSVSQQQSLTVTGTTTTSISSSGSAGNYTLTGTVSAAGATTLPAGTVTFADAIDHFALGSGTLGAGSTALSLGAAGSPSLGTWSPYWTAVGDFNGDGKLDLVTADAASGPVGSAPTNALYVFLGNGDGTFTAAPASPLTNLVAYAIAAGDFNNDGKTDLAVLNSNNAVSILLGNGDGTFNLASSSPETGTYPDAVAVADFDGDGNLDLAVANGGESSLTILLGNGEGGFTPVSSSPETGSSPLYVVAADFNGDGKADLAVVDSGATAVSILLGTGDGTFTAGTGLTLSGALDSAPGNAMALGDFNGDGKVDLAVESLSQSAILVNVFTGRGDGTFTAQPLIQRTGGTNGYSIGAADFNRDGYTDLVAFDDTAVTVYLSKGNGTFTAAASGTGSTTSPDNDYLAIGAFTGSGLPDLALADSDLTNLNVLLFQSTGSATATLAGVSIPGSGSQNITASYGGSTLLGSSTSAPIQLTGSLVSTALTLSASANSVNAGQPVTMTATLKPYSDENLTTNGESVSFSSGGKVLGSGSLASGVATFTTASLPAGAYSVTAMYGGDGAFASSVSSPVSITVVGPAIPKYQFVAIAPCRIADTRNATGAFGGPELGAASTRSFAVPQSACGIPATAVAYSLNVTVVPNGELDYLTLWPQGQAQPNVSTLNSLDGRIKANAAIVPAGTNGGVSVYVSDATNVILDIDGYFVPAGASAGLEFYPLTPCRIADTRGAAGALGGPSLPSGGSRAFPILSSACNIPASAQAYSLNVTAVPHAKLNYLTMWPTGQAQPNVSTLNAPTGAVTANAAIVPSGTNGEVSVFVSDAADVILDVNGYFAAPGTGGLSLYAVTPCRIIDTRPNAFNGVIAVNVEASACAPPAMAQAYVLNATVVPPAALDYLTLWPQGEAQPNVSTLNALDGAITSNMAIVPTTNGSIDAFSSNATNLILDMSGYFAP